MTPENSKSHTANIKTRGSEESNPRAAAPGSRTADAEDDLIETVTTGLRSKPKSLPCRLFYDEAGSDLFERICELPEYYLTRTEAEILTRSADEIAAQLSSEVGVVELGSGSGSKTKSLLQAILKHRSKLRYSPIDVSKRALKLCILELQDDLPELKITPIQAEYLSGFEQVKRESKSLLVVWLGSSIGNFTREEAADFLARLRKELRTGDRLLISFDLRKGRRVLERAYDDEAGVTALFNKNILVRLNRELGADFDPECFAHRAVYNEADGRVEMHLVSKVPQTVTFQRCDLTVHFFADEVLHTENSYKYSEEEIRQLAKRAGLTVYAQWQDANRGFTCVMMQM